MIHVVCTVGLKQIALVPQFVAHYRALGVGRIWLTLHVGARLPATPAADAICTEAMRLLEKLGTEPLPFLIGDFDAMLVRKRHDAIQGARIPSGDWVLWADTDEFQVYPRALAELLAEADAQNANAIGGELVDRVARDGALIRFDPALPVWRQFPLGSDVTRRVLQGFTHKVAASKGNVLVGPGHHEALPSSPVPVIWARDLAAIHHFKWDDGVIARLALRTEDDWKRRCPWWVESQRFLDHAAEHGHIDLTGADTYDFGDGMHRADDAAAWAYVTQQRAANVHWHLRKGMQDVPSAVKPDAVRQAS